MDRSKGLDCRSHVSQALVFWCVGVCDYGSGGGGGGVSVCAVWVCTGECACVSLQVEGGCNRQFVAG